MSKDLQLHKWLWKWHMIAGLITLPFMLLLSVTGAIYLFKDDVNQAIYEDIYQVEATGPQRFDYAEQLSIVQSYASMPVSQVQIPVEAGQATAFWLQGHGHSRHNVYVNPYNGEVTGDVDQSQTLMYDIRKLHGELLLHTPGTLVIELVASWFLLLIITGLYVWLPQRKFRLKSFFVIRVKEGGRTLWRDTHAVLGFLMSLFLLIILAGGMPWTNVFGSQLKWVQKQTDTGYPTHWRARDGLKSQPLANQQAISIDEVLQTDAVSQLTGKLTLTLPQDEQGVYSVSNRSFYLSDQQVVYVDQYSGAVIQHYTWEDVGFLMDVRQVFMRLHQGEYGFSNWLVALLVCVLFTLSTIAGLVSYLYRKPKQGWGIVKTPEHFRAGRIVLTCLVVLGVMFPLLGGSLVLLFCYEKISAYRRGSLVEAS